MFYEAWPVVGGEAIFEVAGDPIVARQKVGKGQIVVIGDSSFLLNKNLEVIDGAILQNVRFFSWLLRRVMNG